MYLYQYRILAGAFLLCTKTFLGEVVKHLFCNISIAIASAKSVVTIQPSNTEKQRSLSKCD